MTLLAAIFLSLLTVVSCYYRPPTAGIYGGISFPGQSRYYGYPDYGQPNGYPGPAWPNNYNWNSPYGYGNYGQQPALPELISDISIALLRSFTNLVAGDSQPMRPPPPYMPYGPQMPYGRPVTSQFGHEVNVYAGADAGISGSSSMLGPNGPYGSGNNNVGSTFSGLSSWPWIQPQPQRPTAVPPSPVPTQATQAPRNVDATGELPMPVVDNNQGTPGGGAATPGAVTTTSPPA